MIKNTEFKSRFDAYVDKTPKIIVDVQGELELCLSNDDDINSTFGGPQSYELTETHLLQRL